MSDAQIAERALRCLDLTDLTDTCTDQAIDALCKKALDPRGPVAAVCVWPQFVKRSQENLRGSPVRIATVVNFPAGGEDVSRVTDDTQEALSDGANEIDLVLPYEALRRLGRSGPVVAPWFGTVIENDIVRAKPGHPEYMRVPLDVPFVSADRVRGGNA